MNALIEALRSLDASSEKNSKSFQYFWLKVVLTLTDGSEHTAQRFPRLVMYRAAVQRVAMAVASVLLSACSQIDSLLYQPEITPQEWCEAMPCVEPFSSGLILNQPSSTFLVYALGLMWLWAGWRFWQTQNAQHSRRWWAIAMALGGIAALSAGTSYQAFGYELKCAGRELCTWTSWWEIAYLVIQIGSVNAMLVGVAYACTVGKTRRRLIAYALFNTVAHWCVTVAGISLAHRLLLSFELLLLFSSPTFLIFFWINGLRYFRHKNVQDKVLLGAWAIMILTNALYYVYLQLDITGVLWSRGLWFSENDVLHVLMMLWVLYVGTAVVNVTADTPAQSNA